MIWLGLLAGLLAFQALRLLSQTGTAIVPTVALPAPDPWAESRRSRQILETQEAAPTPVPIAASGAADFSGGIRVIDGDTFDYGTLRVRIADIDTPELRGRCTYETDLAVRATTRLAALLADGGLELHPLPDGRDQDRYGRKLRIVTRNGRSLGDILVAEGLARTWTGRREPWC